MRHYYCASSGYENMLECQFLYSIMTDYHLLKKKKNIEDYQWMSVWAPHSR